jgi:hypothetical protein
MQAPMFSSLLFVLHAMTYGALGLQNLLIISIITAIEAQSQLMT